MVRLEYLPNKSQLVQNYYKWLLDDNNISLKSVLDLSLAPHYDDPHIYYSECMHDLFHTSILQKLDKITQLSSMYQIFPDAYHSRLEHSIATYEKNRKSTYIYG